MADPLLSRLLDLTGLFQGVVFVKLYAPRMIQMTLATLGFCGSLVLCTACQDNEHVSRPSGSITVKVPVPQGNGYKLDLLELTTLRDVVQMQGEAAHFLFSPSLVNGKLQGYEPRVRLMRTKDNVYVAEDSLSLQILTLYANFEKLMKMDESLGVKQLNEWPRPVAVNTRILDEAGKSSRDNARYSGQLDAFLFEPFSRVDLPLTVNAGVIGHEHFHSLFYQLVLKNLGGFYTKASHVEPHDLGLRLRSLGFEFSIDLNTSNEPLTESQIYQTSLLRGMNEGFADVWGWVYSGDTDFVARSLSFEKTRDLNLFAEPIPTLDHFMKEVRPFSDLKDTLEFSYKIGSQYAQILRHLVQVENIQRGRTQQKPGDREPELRLKLARALLRALPRLTTAIQALKQDELLAPSRAIEILSEEISFLTPETCLVLKGKVPEASQKSICKTMSVAAKAEKKGSTP